MNPNSDLQNKKKLYLIIGILVILILLVLRSLITSQNNAIIDYNDIDTGSKLIVDAELTKEREIYYIAQDIISKLIGAYADEVDDNDIMDYYYTLNKSYRNKISRNEYLKLVKQLFSKLTVTDSSGMGDYDIIQSVDCIRSIYKLQKDTYLCVLGISQNMQRGFIGLKLDTDNNLYEIFYLE